MKNQIPYLYIPLEIYRRELNGMTLLALLAAKSGFRVVMGGKKVMLPILSEFPEGIILLKSIVPGELDLQKRIISYGHKVTSVDAEGLLPSNGRSGVELRYGKETIDLSEKLFFWGKEQYEQVKDVFPNIVDKAEVTGSPIFDYWRYLKLSSSKSRLASKKKTILIATSFPYPNHFIDRKMSYDSVKDASGEQASKEHLNEIFLDGELQDLVYPKFREFVKRVIQERTDCRIILRPHPGENPDAWSKLGEGYKHVEMSLSGEISPILLESDILIHFNSTTSIEANFYDKSVITYIPKEVPDKLFGRLNSHALQASLQASNIDDAMKLVQQSFDRKGLKTELNLGSIIENSDSQRIIHSCESIISSLKNIDRPKVKKDFPSLLKINLSFTLLKSIIRSRAIWIVSWIDHLTGIFSGKYARFRNNYRYGKSKQGHLDINKIRELIGATIIDNDVKEGDIRVKKVKAGLVVIEKRQ